VAILFQLDIAFADRSFSRTLAAKRFGPACISGLRSAVCRHRRVPDDVSVLLDLECDSSFILGETLWENPKYEIRNNTNTWELSSEHKVMDSHSASHISWIIELLRNKFDALEKLGERGVQIDLRVNVIACNKVSIVEIASPDLVILSELKINLTVFYSHPNDDILK
jgi:hypothetical protein